MRMRWLLASIGLLTGYVADVSPGSSLGRMFYAAEEIDENDFVIIFEDEPDNALMDEDFEDDILQHMLYPEDTILQSTQDKKG